MASSTLVAWPAATRQRAICGRPSDAPARRRPAEELVHLLVDREAELAKPRHDPLEARDAEVALPLQGGLEGLVTGSTPRPRMWSSPSHRPSMPVATLLISTAGSSSSGRAAPGWGAQLADAGQRVVVGQGEDPTPSRGRLAPARAARRTPSERRL